MTVKELIGKLSELPQDAEIKLLNHDDCGEYDCELDNPWICNGGYALLSSGKAYMDEYMPKGEHPAPREPIDLGPWAEYIGTKMMGHAVDNLKLAFPVNETTFQNAVEFIKAFPEGFCKPELAATEDGDIYLEWAQSAGRLVVVTISDNQNVAYAWLNGDKHGNGSYSFTGFFDPVLYDRIRDVLG